MIYLKRDEFKKLLEQNLGKRFAFFEYEPIIFKNSLHITHGNEKYPTFGADTVAPYSDTNDDFIFSYDWNLGEYSKNDMFVVLEYEEINGLISDLNETAASWLTDIKLDGIKKLDYYGEEGNKG